LVVIVLIEATFLRNAPEIRRPGRADVWQAELADASQETHPSSPSSTLAAEASMLANPRSRQAQML
jgi:hypothetical protein